MPILVYEDRPCIVWRGDFVLQSINSSLCEKLLQYLFVHPMGAKIIIFASAFLDIPWHRKGVFTILNEFNKNNLK